MDPRIAEIEQGYMRNDLPAFAPGDTVRVRVRVREGQKERVQPFEGICIGKRGSGVNATFTLRRVSGGVGVERIFPLHSPWIEGLEVVRRGDVRRAKLYYLRARKGKRARVRERRWWLDKESIAERTGKVAAPTPEEAAEEIAEEAAEDVVAVEEVTETVAEAGDGTAEAADDAAEAVEEAEKAEAATE